MIDRHGLPGLPVCSPCHTWIDNPWDVLFLCSHTWIQKSELLWLSTCLSTAKPKFRTMSMRIVRRKEDDTVGICRRLHTTECGAVCHVEHTLVVQWWILRVDLYILVIYDTKTSKGFEFDRLYSMLRSPPDSYLGSCRGLVWLTYAFEWAKLSMVYKTVM